MYKQSGIHSPARANRLGDTRLPGRPQSRLMNLQVQAAALAHGRHLLLDLETD